MTNIQKTMLVLQMQNPCSVNKICDKFHFFTCEMNSLFSLLDFSFSCKHINLLIIKFKIYVWNWQNLYDNKIINLYNQSIHAKNNWKFWKLSTSPHKSQRLPMIKWFMVYKNPLNKRCFFSLHMLHFHITIVISAFRSALFRKSYPINQMSPHEEW